MQKRIFTIPTLFTLSRFFLVPYFAYLFMQRSYNLAFWILVITGLTDALDGFIARRFKMTSRFGSFLDPLADKFLMIVSYILFWWENIIPEHLFYLVIGRDIGIMLSIVILTLILRVKLYYKPTIVSKFATFFQILVLCVLFLNILIERNFKEIHGVIDGLLFYAIPTIISLAIITTVISAIQYAYMGIKFYKYGERLKK